MMTMGLWSLVMEVVPVDRSSFSVTSSVPRACAVVVATIIKVVVVEESVVNVICGEPFLQLFMLMLFPNALPWSVNFYLRRAR